ncbi:MAG: hypothetical protein OXG87_17235 [Gemmatimonadetes bacterium]|nr:hypothetical protein [Gemmatimonadota bacterium]
MSKGPIENPTERFDKTIVLKIHAFEDIIPKNVFYITGSAGNISTFIIHKHGDNTISDDHTRLEPMYGTMAYGEPVKRIVISRKTLRIKRNPQQVYWKPIIVPEISTLDDRANELVQLVQSWVDEGDADEQRETLEYLIQALDEDRPSNRKLFPKELKGKSW